MHGVDAEDRGGGPIERGKVGRQRIFDSGQSFNFIVFDLVANKAEIAFLVSFFAIVFWSSYVCVSIVRVVEGW